MLLATFSGLLQRGVLWLCHSTEVHIAVFEVYTLSKRYKICNKQGVHVQHMHTPQILLSFQLQVFSPRQLVISQQALAVVLYFKLGCICKILLDRLSKLVVTSEQFLRKIHRIRYLVLLYSLLSVISFGFDIISHQNVSMEFKSSWFSKNCNKKSFCCIIYCGKGKIKMIHFHLEN